MEVPELVIKEELNDVSAQLRVQKIENGFLVRAGKTPVFYKSIAEAAEAVKLALLNASWPKGAI